MRRSISVTSAVIDDAADEVLHRNRITEVFLDTWCDGRDVIILVPAKDRDGKPNLTVEDLDEE